MGRRKWAAVALIRQLRTTSRRSDLVLGPIPGGQVQRLYGCDLCLRDGLDVEPTVRVQLRDSDGLGILSQENSDEDLQDSALKLDPNELAREPLSIALIHRTQLRNGWRSPGINPLTLNASGSRGSESKDPRGETRVCVGNGGYYVMIRPDVTRTRSQSCTHRDRWRTRMAPLE